MVFADDDPRRKVILLLYQGTPMELIAEQLGSTVEAVRKWADEAQHMVVEHQKAHPEEPDARLEAAKPRVSPEMRMDHARALLDEASGWGPILRVEPSGVEGCTHNVTFNDLASHGFSDLVEETVKLLRADQRIKEARREDRELILVSAPGISDLALSEQLTSWWTQRLREVAEGRV
jgi:hypothetical protein